MTIAIKKVEDFAVTGDGTNPAWEKADWQELKPIGRGRSNYETKGKILWSSKGIYFYFECEDKILTCTKEKDFEEIYLEDVIEVFLWPDEKQVVYFEYEISPLGYELPLIVPNCDGRFHGWLPFLYEDDRKVISKTLVIGGEKKSMAQVKGWTAEFFIPFKLMLGLKNNPPKEGMTWRANMCRIDYDEKPRTQWSWAVNTGENFHDFNNYGNILFID